MVRRQWWPGWVVLEEEEGEKKEGEDRLDESIILF